MTDAAPPIDSDNLPPTQYLILEVLAARYRTGEPFWTFPTRPPIVRAAQELEKAGLVWLRSGPAPRAFQVWFTDAGEAAALSESYQTPAQRQAEEIPDGATTWLYLVVDTEGGYRRYTTDRERAHEVARDTGCVVAMLPIVGDYRHAVDDPDGTGSRKEGER